MKEKKYYKKAYKKKKVTNIENNSKCDPLFKFIMEDKQKKVIHELPWGLVCRITPLSHFVGEYVVYKGFVQSKQISVSEASIVTDLKESIPARNGVGSLFMLPIWYNTNIKKGHLFRMSLRNREVGQNRGTYVH